MFISQKNFMNCFEKRYLKIYLSSAIQICYVPHEYLQINVIYKIKHVNCKLQIGTMLIICYYFRVCQGGFFCI